MVTVENMLQTMKFAQPAYWSRETGIPLSTLRSAIRAGNLKSVTLIDGTVLLSQQDVREYARNRPKRGPKTD